jgi:uncharacterized protein (TIGR02145 family)
MKTKYYAGLGFLQLNALIVCMSLSSCSDKAGNAPVCPDENHPHMIDLGLPDGTLWSCCNVGAPQPEEAGGFYSWGEIEVKSVYDDAHYMHGEVSNKSAQSMGSIAGSKYDAATVRMGQSWQIPSSEQWQELIDYCTKEYCSYQGHHGLMFTGPNSNRIFVPAGGTRYGQSEWHSKDEQGSYWASNMSDTGQESACAFGFHESWSGVGTDNRLSSGMNIRPVAR